MLRTDKARPKDAFQPSRQYRSLEVDRYMAAPQYIKIAITT